MHARDRKSNANICIYSVSPSRMPPAESVRMSTTGWIMRWWSIGPLLPKLLREREEERLTKSTVVLAHSWCSSMRWYEIYIQLEHIETRFILFTCRHQQWRPDPGSRTKNQDPGT
jgi:hypothetical protein